MKPKRNACRRIAHSLLYACTINLEVENFSACLYRVEDFGAPSSCACLAKGFCVSKRAQLAERTTHPPELAL
jgi:hypothetical protein